MEVVVRDVGGKGKSMNEPGQPGNRGSEKQAVWIRPGGSSLKIGKSALQPLAASSVPSKRSIFRLGFHLVGAGIVVISTCYLLANGSGFFSISPLVSISPTMPIRVESALCAEIEQCLSKKTAIGKATTTPGASGQTPTPVSVGKPTPAPRPSPEPTPQPSPTPTLTLDPTPSAPLLVVAPQSLVVSQVAVCDAGLSVPMTLTNQGGALLLWSEDTRQTSRGIRVSDPTGKYLIMPGLSANVVVRCWRGLPRAQYTLVIDFNGGVVRVPVIVTV